MPDLPDLTNTPTVADETATDTVPAGPPLAFRDLFIGSEGLRAGWSLLLAVFLFLTLMIGGGFLVHALHPAAPSKTGADVPMAPATAFLSEGLALLCVALTTWIMATVEHRTFSVFGFANRRGLHNFFAGLAWGAALLSLLVLSLRATGFLVFDARQLFGRSALHYGAVWLGGFLLVGLLEEYLFRGYLQVTLARGLNGICDSLHIPRRETLGFWAAAVLLSFGFGLTHRSNPGETPIGLRAAGLIGLVFCLSLWRTGSLWWAIGFHASWDWAQSFLYGVADSGLMVRGHLFATHPVGRPILSGGLTGPEGSILILPILALTTAVILLTLPNTRRADTPHPDPI